MRRSYGSHNLPSPPTSTGRLLRIEIPAPKNDLEMVQMAETYGMFANDLICSSSVKDFMRRLNRCVRNHLASRCGREVEEVPDQEIDIREGIFLDIQRMKRKTAKEKRKFAITDRVEADRLAKVFIALVMKRSSPRRRSKK